MFSTLSRTVIAGGLVAGSLAFASPAGAQSKPFPTSGHYAQGFIPSAATTAAVQSSYASWKTNYLKTDCGNGYYRVDDSQGNSTTLSEGQGYGMVLTAYFGDKTAFDGLWAFAKKNYNSMGMMGWHETCSGFTTSDGGAGDAADADQDIGFALIVAAAQWGGSYASDAMAYLATMKTVDFYKCSPSGRTVVTPGNGYGIKACTTSGTGINTSYIMPAYYRVFQAFTGDSFWGTVADDAVTLYGLAADPTTGIIVDYVDQDGVALSNQTYDYNTCRLPWRAALDYVWYGTPAVQTELNKLSGWVNSVGLDKIVDGYDANGTATGMYTGLNAFDGAFSVGAMTDSASMSGSFATYFVGIANDNGTYYGSSLRTLYLLTLSGNQWNPVEVGDGGTAPVSDDGGDGSDASANAGAEGGAAPGGDDSGALLSGSSGGLGSGSSGGTLLSYGDAGPSNAAASPANGTAAGGCGCRTVAGERSTAGGSGLAMLAGVLLLRRRRR